MRNRNEIEKKLFCVYKSHQKDKKGGRNNNRVMKKESLFQKMVRILFQ